MEQSSPIANKMFDSKYSVMNIPGKNVQCPWKLVKSVDEEGNITYNLVNLYEKGNERLLEEQYMDENPKEQYNKQSSAKILKPESTKNLGTSKLELPVEKKLENESKLKAKKETGFENSSQPRASPLEEKRDEPRASPLEEKRDEPRASPLEEKREEPRASVLEEKRDEMNSETPLLSKIKQFEEHENENETSASILQSAQAALNVLTKVSKFIKSNKSNALDKNLERNIQNLFQKYYKEIIGIHEYAHEFVGYIQDDLRTSKNNKKYNFLFNSFSSNMLPYSVTSKAKLLEHSRPLHFRKGYSTFFNNFTIFLYGGKKKIPLNGLDIDITFHFFQNDKKLKYFRHTEKNLQLDSDENKKGILSITALTQPVKKLISENTDSEITMSAVINFTNKSTHILPLDISAKCLISYELQQFEENNLPQLMESETFTSQISSP
jgi:hypothetical protein